MPSLVVVLMLIFCKNLKQTSFFCLTTCFCINWYLKWDKIFYEWMFLYVLVVDIKKDIKTDQQHSRFWIQSKNLCDVDQFWYLFEDFFICPFQDNNTIIKLQPILISAQSIIGSDVSTIFELCMHANTSSHIYTSRFP